MLKKIMRKTLSVVLSIMMLLTTCSAAMSMIAQASVSTASGPSLGDVTFVVPEAIYLAPAWNSYYQTITMPFQFYVNNTVNSSGGLSLENGEKTTGKIYFRYENATSANITFEWVNENGQVITGGTITYGDGTARSAGNGYTMGSSTSPINITAGTSPAMAPTQTGTYLRWTATFTDNADNLVKSAVAYTYVYKPYNAPIGVAQKTCNDRGSNHWGQSVSWISGMHGIKTNNGTHYANTTATSDGKGLMTFSSSGSMGIPIDALNAQLASTNNSVSRWYYTGMNNTGVGGWLNQNESTKPLPDKTIRYFENNLTGHSSGDDAFHNREFSPTAVLYADKTRYTNFNQIPNISTGLMVTDDEASDGNGAWFVADYWGSWMEDHDRDYFKSQNTALGIWNQYRSTYATIIKSVGNNNSTVSGAESEGVKYNGRYNKAFSSSGGFAVSTGYYNHDGADTIWHIAELRISLTVRDNSVVRTALQNAIKKTATLQAMFYDPNNTTWINYTELYRAGYMAMTKIDGPFVATATVNGTTKTYASESEFATALNDAVSKLTSTNANSYRLSRTAVQRNVAITPIENGKYRVVELSGSTRNTTSFVTFQTVTFTADDVTGYTYKGFVATASETAPAVGSTLNALPSFTTSAYGAAISGAQVRYVHTQSQGTDGRGNLYYTYYYTPNSYKVRFDSNGGSGAMSDQSFVYNTAQALSPNTFIRVGYTFAGWATSAGGALAYADKATVNSLASTDGAVVTLYAKWTPITYSISFNPNGGQTSGTVPNNYTIETLLTLPLATKSGYNLVGWRADNSGNWGGMLFTRVGSNMSAGMYGNVTMTAVWEAATYTVVFNANGGEGNMAAQSFTYDQAQTLSTNAFTRTGYTFRGWGYTENAEIVAYRDKDIAINLADTQGDVVNLYALWAANNYTIIYKEEGGTIRDSLSSYTSTYTVNDRVQLPVQVERSGYTFKGWMPTTSAGTWTAQTLYNGLQNSGLLGNVTLAAQWETQSYTITYIAAGGTISGTSHTTNYNITSSITIPSAARTGYAFQGWKANDVGSWGESIYTAGRLNASMYGDVTLTAQWLGNTYYISFNSNGGTSGVMRDQTMIYGQSKQLSPNAFVRPGYTFLGWGDSNTDTQPDYLDNTSVSNLSSEQGAVVTLYAVWSKDIYTISYEENGGNVSEEGTTRYSVTDRIAMPVASRRGYTLSGWTPVVSSGSWIALELYNDTLSPGMFGNVTLRAQWVKSTYTITWLAAGGTLSGKYTTEYDIDTIITMPTITRPGYAFSGWQADETWDNVFFVDTAPVSKIGDVSITAVWQQRIYTVVFDPSGGVGTMEDQTFQCDTAEELTANAFTKRGYTFAGWTTIKNDTVVDFEDGALVYNLSETDGGTVYLYAVWTPVTFSVQYNLNGGSGYMAPSSVAMNGSVTLREVTKTDVVIGDHAFRFAGWALSKDDADNGVAAYTNKGTLTVNDALLDSITINMNVTRPVITLYAVWSSIEIELDLVEESGIVLDKTHNTLYGIDQRLTAEDMSEYLGVNGNGHLEFEYTSFIGTGTVVKLINDYTNELEDTFTVVLFGDLNGDGAINNGDFTVIKSMIIGSTDSSFNTVYGQAADLNGDGDVNNGDLGVMKSLIVGTAYLNQSTHEVTAA